MLDRMDLSAEMSRIPFEELLKKQPKGTKEEDSAAIRSRVEKVQKIQARRYEGTSYRFNGDLDSAGVQKYCALGAAEEKLLEGMYQKFSLTARSCHRLLKVARTWQIWMRVKTSGKSTWPRRRPSGQPMRNTGDKGGVLWKNTGDGLCIRRKSCQSRE